jgi:hypothetical protein
LICLNQIIRTMVVEVLMYACKCDNCEKEWVDPNEESDLTEDSDSIENSVSEDCSWTTTPEGLHFCNACSPIEGAEMLDMD